MGEIFTPDNLFAGNVQPVVAGAGTVTGGDYARGTVLGKIGLSLGAVSAAAENTGDGTCEVELGNHAKPGYYSILIHDAGAKTYAAAAPVADPGNTGDGACTLSDPSTGAAAKEGTYTLTCIETSPFAMFKVVGPDGDRFDDAIIGVEYDGPVRFTIGAGGEAFVLSDSFTIEVTGTVVDASVMWVVTDPDQVPHYAMGMDAPLTNGPLFVTLSQGAVPFAKGDMFSVTVGEGSGKLVPVDSTAVDGSDRVFGVLAEDVEASLADVEAGVYLTGEFNEAALTFGGTDTADTHREAARALGIHFKTAVSA